MRVCPNQADAIADRIDALMRKVATERLNAGWSVGSDPFVNEAVVSIDKAVGCLIDAIGKLRAVRLAAEQAARAEAHTQEQAALLRRVNELEATR